jgi:hypothetical protein
MARSSARLSTLDRLAKLMTLPPKLRLAETATNVSFVVVALAGVTALQIFVPSEVSVFPLYLVPVAMCMWYFGQAGAYACAVLATVLWIVADISSGRTYSVGWYRYQNAVSRAVVFFGTAYFLGLYQRTLEIHRRRLAGMRQLLPICHGCGSVQGSDGRWHPYDQLGSLDLPDRNECPGCNSAHTSKGSAAGEKST